MPPLRAAIAQAEAATAAGAACTSASPSTTPARDAILAAARGLPELSREALERALGPPVDLLIRTGGEQRLSDFLLWECAYAELVFTPHHVARFRRADLARRRPRIPRAASAASAPCPRRSPPCAKRGWIKAAPSSRSAPSVVGRACRFDARFQNLEPDRLYAVPAKGFLAGALSCFFCSSCLCFVNCCCLFFSLSFLPPLSPMPAPFFSDCDLKS